MPTRFKGTSNPEYIEAMRQIRRSSASSPHKDRRSRRARTRSAQLRRAVRDST